ncbi:MAG: gamma-glutamyltransferase [Anaerolineae bacterium]|nr:gamma-glutamyltransferase [Anaerolineae bacterium]
MKGVIAGGSQQTVAAGAEMFRQGGNAVDAAVAAAFASYMGEVMLSTPGGGGFALVYGPDHAPVVYDFFCATPCLGNDRRGAADLDFAPVTVVYESGTSVYHLGRGSSAVPGDVAGLTQLLEEAGTLPLETVLQPAIRLAREGVVLNDYQAYLIRLVDMIFDYDASCRAIYAPGGDWLKAGERLVNHALANTLETIASDGWQAFYTGDIGAAIVADQAAHGGLITAGDLAAYKVIKREPLRFEYKGNTIYTNPPPSAGGILIAYAMRLFGNADLSDLMYGGGRHVALLAEIMQQTNIARQRDRPMRLPHAPAWRAWLSARRLSSDWVKVMAALMLKRTRPGPNEPAGPKSTTHISVMDETGLCVGLSFTSGETAGYFVDGTGVLMNNMLGEDELNPDGFHHWKPGQRLSSMMAPTIVVENDSPRLVVGSGGAARLRSAIFQVLSNVLDWRMPVADAVARSRVHYENNVLHLEGGSHPGAPPVLEARGYTLNRWDKRTFYFGGTHAVQCDPDGTFSGAGDIRRGGAVAVVD